MADKNLNQGDPTQSGDGVAPGASDDGKPATGAEGNLIQKQAEATANAIKDAEGTPPEVTPPAAETTPPVETPPVTPPAFTIDDYKLDLGKNAEGVDLNTLEDGGVLDRFKTFNVENDISPEVAQKLIEHQQKELSDATQQMIDAGTTLLKGQWGNNYEVNKQKGLVALTVLDRKMGGRLTPAFKQSGAINDPVIIEALYQIGAMIGEDNLGAGGPGGAEPETEVTTEKAYEDMWNKAKK